MTRLQLTQIASCPIVKHKPKLHDWQPRMANHRHLDSFQTRPNLNLQTRFGQVSSYFLEVIWIATGRFFAKLARMHLLSCPRSDGAGEPFYALEEQTKQRPLHLLAIERRSTLRCSSVFTPSAVVAILRSEDNATTARSWLRLPQGTLFTKKRQMSDILRKVRECDCQGPGR
jgi:hypothetical protein